MGWIANILFVVGVYVLGNKKRYGFILNGIANAIYGVVGITHSMPDLLAISGIMTGLNAWNYWKWCRPAKTPLLFFTERKRLSEDAVKWCRENRAEQTPLGIVCALQHLGVDLRRNQ